MKKLLVIFLIGQMLVCSFIYGQSLYDIFFLNNIGCNDLNTYYLQEPNGIDLGILYDVLIENEVSIEIIKEPISMDGVMAYDVYDTTDLKVDKIVPITKSKKVSYQKLTRDDFVDSTGKFRTNLTLDQINKMLYGTGIQICEHTEEGVDYKQVFWENRINFLILIILTQLILFIYTFSRIKINAIKKLNGFSSWKMITDSFREFLFDELLATFLTIVIHIVYCSVKQSFCISYFIGLVITILVVFFVTIFQLLITQCSIRLIDISLMIKNKTYSPFWNTSMNIAKIIFVFMITLSVSLLSESLEGYGRTLVSIEKYRKLDSFFTSSGYNSNEYDKLFSNKEFVEEMSENVSRFYDENLTNSILIDANITSLASGNYYEISGITYAELLETYSENYVVVNKNYFDKYVQLVDVLGEKISFSDSAYTVLVPEKYRGQDEIEEFCKEQITTFLNYDNIYKREPEQEIDNINIIYIKNDQEIPILDEYLLDNNETVRGSIVFLDSGDFAGTWYLEQLSKGKLAFQLSDRQQYKIMLEKYGLDKLLSVGTMLTPLAEKVRYYEFLLFQSGVFVALFIMSLCMIIYFSNYLEIMINRKKYALKSLFGFTRIKTIMPQIMVESIMLLLAIPLLLLKIRIGTLIVSVASDILILLVLMQSLVVNKVSDIMKGE